MTGYYCKDEQGVVEIRNHYYDDCMLIATKLVVIYFNGD